ncbi:DNA repair protein RecO [Candidatus Saccharibacteria bacterium]|nr:DNA repair protein RecO [Candidatus Saccharibacteria bacterium]
MSSEYLRTFGYVLKRTNYAEADRILNIITPSGKISAIAKGVRREKSKLAGGIEIFSLVDFNIHFGRGDLGIVTGAKMLKHYSEILKNYERMELASLFLKKINSVAENSDAKEFFDILGQSLIALNNGYNLKLIEAWFLLNLTRASGEEINLYRDINGERLEASKWYDFDKAEGTFFEKENGEFGVNEIKMLRLMITSDFDVIRRVKISSEVVVKILQFAKIVSKT